MCKLEFPRRNQFSRINQINQLSLIVVYPQFSFETKTNKCNKIRLKGTEYIYLEQFIKYNSITAIAVINNLLLV